MPSLTRYPARAPLYLARRSRRPDDRGGVGRVRISLTGPDGHELILNIIEAGQLFGEIAMLDGHDRTADATVLEASELLTIDRRDFLPFLARHPEVAVRLLLTLCQRMRRTTDQIEDIFLLPVTARFGQEAARDGDPARPSEPEGVRIGARLSQRELGGMLGVSRESINKHLGVWQKAGFVRLENGATRSRTAPRSRAWPTAASSPGWHRPTSQPHPRARRQAARGKRRRSGAAPRPGQRRGRCEPIHKRGAEICALLTLVPDWRVSCRWLSRCVASSALCCSPPRSPRSRWPVAGPPIRARSSEDVQGAVKDVQVFDYLAAGTQVQLPARGVLVLGYLKSCARETITGGKVTVRHRPERGRRRPSQARDRRVRRRPHAADHRPGGQSGVMVFRANPRRPRRRRPRQPQLTIYGVSPIVTAAHAERLEIKRLDSSGQAPLDFPVAKRSPGAASWSTLPSRTSR